MSRKSVRLMFTLALLLQLTISAAAAQKATLNTSVDLYSRYVWRGLDIASTPSAQPSLSIAYAGCELGVWGAYTLSNQSSSSDEIDFWLSYTHAMGDGASITAIATDYYFPNAGIKFFNFNNYDATIDDTIPDPGAHTVEMGISLSGPESLPVVVSGYVNVYNDAGSNTYFQLDYPVTVNETDLVFFCGAAGGSKDNPGYYGSKDFAVINAGLSAMRDIKVSENLSVPLTVSFVVNPKAEISYLIVGMSF